MDADVTQISRSTRSRTAILMPVEDLIRRLRECGHPLPEEAPDSITYCEPDSVTAEEAAMGKVESLGWLEVAWYVHVPDANASVELAPLGTMPPPPLPPPEPTQEETERNDIWHVWMIAQKNHLLTVTEDHVRGWTDAQRREMVNWLWKKRQGDPPEHLIPFLGK